MDFWGLIRWLRPAFSRVSTKNLPLIVFPRLDFQTFSGFEVDTVTTGIGVCTDSFQAAGQTGVNPPAICGTNTGYHSNWVRLSGPVSVCSVSVRGVWSCCWRHDHTDQHPRHWHLQLEHPRQADLLHLSLEVSQSWFNIIQWRAWCRAPTDCVQYFTGISDTVQNYNYGNQMLQNQN